MDKLKALDLFSGIGGFSLGLDRSGGFETVAFCEIEKFPQKVLKKHWPDVPIYEDVRELTNERLIANGITVDVITGGFPCQDLSVAGNQGGINAERSGLWSEIIRLASEIRPKYIIVENVANLLSGPAEKRGAWFGRVLSDLAQCGYDAEWQNIPAASLGAPHLRERVWIVAYPTQERPIGGFQVLRQERLQRELRRIFRKDGIFGKHNPRVSYVDDGFPNGLDGHYAAGNSVIPEIPELIGNLILQQEKNHG